MGSISSLGRIPSDQGLPSGQKTKLRDGASILAKSSLEALEEFKAASSNESLSGRIDFPHDSMENITRRIEGLEKKIINARRDSDSPTLKDAKLGKETLIEVKGKYEEEYGKFKFKQQQMKDLQEKTSKLSQLEPVFNQINQLNEDKKNAREKLEEKGLSKDTKKELYCKINDIDIELKILIKGNEGLSEQVTNLKEDIIFINNILKLDVSHKTNIIKPKGYQGKTESNLTPALLKSIISLAAQNLGRDIEHEHSGVRFIAKLEHTGNLELIQIGKRLGQGGFSTAFESLDLKTGAEEVYKHARADLGNRNSLAVEGISNEVNILSEIHADGPVYGIQAQPSRVVVLTKMGGEEEVGYLGKKYDGDYLGKSFEDEKMAYRAFHQILSGLKFLHCEKNIVHGDIKPENILVKNDGTTHLADMGGVKRLDHPDTNPFDIGTFTASKVSSNDIRKLQDLEQRIRVDPKAVSLAKKLRKQMDVFAMGCTIYSGLVAQLNKQKIPQKVDSPYPSTENHPFSKTDEPFVDIVSSDSTHVALNDLIKSMTNPHALKRPTIDQALETFNIIMNDRR